MLHPSMVGYGLNLYGGEPVWTIDAKAMEVVLLWVALLNERI